MRDEARAQRNGQLPLSDRMGQDQTLTPQERLSQLERKLVEVLHEVQALRSQMEEGQHGKTRGNPEDHWPKKSLISRDE